MGADRPNPPVRGDRADDEPVLTGHGRATVDRRPETGFDARLRLVTRADDGVLARLTALCAGTLAPGGVVVVSFTDRTSPTEAVRAWREASTDERTARVGLGHVRTARDPFVAVVGRRA